MHHILIVLIVSFSSLSCLRHKSGQSKSASDIAYSENFKKKYNSEAVFKQNFERAMEDPNLNAVLLANKQKIVSGMSLVNAELPRLRRILEEKTPVLDDAQEKLHTLTVAFDEIVTTIRDTRDIVVGREFYNWTTYKGFVTFLVEKQRRNFYQRPQLSCGADKETCRTYTQWVTKTDAANLAIEADIVKTTFRHSYATDDAEWFANYTTKYYDVKSGTIKGNSKTLSQLIDEYVTEPIYQQTRYNISQVLELLNTNQMERPLYVMWFNEYGGVSNFPPEGMDKRHSGGWNFRLDQNSKLPVLSADGVPEADKTTIMPIRISRSVEVEFERLKTMYSNLVKKSRQ